LSEQSWLEVSLLLDGELVEAVSEVFARFASDGVVIESTGVASSPDDSEGHAVGLLRVCAYLPVDDNLEEKRRKLEEALWYLGRIRSLPEAQYRTIQDQDWSQAWKQHYQPILIGKRLVIVPAWLESPAPERIVIRMDPGMAFGTGTHPTTQLCLELLEACMAQVVPQETDIIDVGCGSGILSIAALKLGARRAVAVDIDPQAVSVAQENAALNGVTAGLEVGLGSVAELRDGFFTIRSGQIVLANILALVIIQLLGAGFADLLAPGGTAIFSGILAEQEGDVAAACEKAGLKVAGRRQSADWVAFQVYHP
jgi:ribosomal protein L11 methyltransferase